MIKTGMRLTANGEMAVPKERKDEPTVNILIRVFTVAKLFDLMGKMQPLAANEISYIGQTKNIKWSMWYAVTVVRFFRNPQELIKPQFVMVRIKGAVNYIHTY